MDDIEKKQQFLVENILNQNYDKEDFAYFLEQQRDNGQDLNEWQFAELKLAVKLFKQKFQPISSNNDENDQQNDQEEQYDNNQQQQIDDAQQQQQQNEQENMQLTNKNYETPQTNNNNNNTAPQGFDPLSSIKPQANQQKIDKQKQLQEQQQKQFEQNLQRQKQEQLLKEQQEKQKQLEQEKLKQQQKQQQENQQKQEVAAPVKAAVTTSNNTQNVVQEQQQQQKQQEVQQKQKSSDPNDYQRYVNCIQTQLNDFFNNKNVAIHIKNYEKKTSGFFSSSYIAYKVKTTPMNWEVERRFSDFRDLSMILKKLYPGISIPPISNKNQMKKYQPIFITKRMSVLEKFLQKIMKNPELKACKFVEGFLRLNDEKEFKEFMKKGDKIKPPINQSLKSLSSIKGVVDLQLNNDIDSFCNNATDLYHNSEMIYRKIKQLSKQLILDFNQCSATLYNLGDQFKLLHEQIDSFNQQTKLEQNKNILLDETYITLNNLCVQWGDTIQSQEQIIRTNFCHFFKYYKSESQSVNETLKMRNENHKKFTDFSQKLHQKKEMLFNNQQFHKWQIPSSLLKQHSEAEFKKNKKLAFQHMLPKETIQESELRDMTAYYSNTIMNDIKRLINEKVQEYSEHFQSFGHLQTDNIQDMHVLWADVMTNLKQLGDGGRKVAMMQKQVRNQDELGDDEVYD